MKAATMPHGPLDLAYRRAARWLRFAAYAGLLAALPHVAAPAQAQQVNEWLEIPNSIADGVKNSVTSPNCKFDAWTSTVLIASKIYYVTPGGHLDICHGQTPAFDLATRTWALVQPPQALSGPVSGCYTVPNGPPGQHTYGDLARIGEREFFVGGNPSDGSADCRTAWKGTIPANDTDPWSWTEWAHLKTFSGIGAAMTWNGQMWIVRQDLRWAIVDTATGAIITQFTTVGGLPTMRGMIINGVEVAHPTGTVSNADDVGTGACLPSGVCFWGTKNYLYRTNLLGSDHGDGNNDSPGRVLRTGLGANAPAGSPQALFTKGAYSTAVWGDKLVFWRGITGASCKQLIVLDPDDNPMSTTGDVWSLIDPPTGPATCTTIPYNKGHVVANADGSVDFYVIPGANKNLWVLRLKDPDPVNQPPVANDDAWVGAEDTQLAGNVLTNDTDDSGPLSAVELTIPPIGSLALNPDGSFTYDPPADYFGDVTFEYTVSDGELTDVGLVTLTIAPVDDPAVVQDESFEMLEEGTLLDTVASNDSDIDSPLVYGFGASDGFSGMPDGSFTFTPPVDFFGIVMIPYTANGVAGLLTITVTDVPDSIQTPDFAARCVGAFYCNGFDAPVATGSSQVVGVWLNGTSGQNSVKPWVENGALWFEQRSETAGAAAGQFHVQFSDPSILGREIMPGDTFYAQWQAEYDQAFIETYFASQTGGVTSYKLFDLSDSGTSSCTANEIILVRRNWGEIDPPLPNRGSLSMYYACGTSEQVEAAGPTTGVYDSQPLANFTPSAARQCWSGNRGGCAELPPHGVKATYMVRLEFAPTAHIALNSRYRHLVHFTLWQKLPGQAPVVVLDVTKDMPAVALGYGRAWWLPYMTNKSNLQIHDVARMYIDEVILSEQPIPFPVD